MKKLLVLVLLAAVATVVVRRVVIPRLGPLDSGGDAPPAARARQRGTPDHWPTVVAKPDPARG